MDFKDPEISDGDGDLSEFNESGDESGKKAEPRAKSAQPSQAVVPTRVDGAICDSAAAGKAMVDLVMLLVSLSDDVMLMLGCHLLKVTARLLSFVVQRILI